MTAPGALRAVRGEPALPAAPVAAQGTVLDLVAEQARLRPGDPAVVHGSTVLSYQRLWERSEDIARMLAARSIGPGNAVGLAARRSADLVVTAVGILRSGAACLPLDPHYPQRRLHMMLADSGVPVVLGHTDVLATLPSGPALVAVDEPGAVTRQADDAHLPPMPSSDDACYVMYTSGSTGTPKGVVQEHRCLVNLARWQGRHSTCGAGSRTAQFAPISFDVAFQEIFCTLGTGGTLVCLNEGDRRDPLRMGQVLARDAVDRLFLPFVALETMAIFSDLLPLERIRLREIITAGEQLKCTAPLRALFQKMPGCRLVNQYGPTETHVVTSHTLGSDVSQWPLLPPIGSPVQGARLHVLDKDLRPVPDGEVGELWVGGVPVARGYWRRPGLTRQRFLPEGGADEALPHGQCYRTGDLVHVTPAGELEFVGRADDQLKVRGIRVEPAEIEALIMEYPGVRAAAVVALGTSPSTRILVAYVVGLDDRQALAELGAYLGRQLPEQLVPARFELIESLPLTPSGKVDRHALQGRQTRKAGTHR